MTDQTLITPTVYEIAGARLPCHVEGAGPPVLLTHGIPGDRRSLLPVARRLADRFEAITVSLPAPPPGARPLRPFGTAGQRDDLIELIAALGRGPVHLVAWSYSAHAALAVAIERPDRIASLFLYEPGFPTFVDDAAARDVVTTDTMAAFAPVAEALGRGDVDAALRLAIDGAADRAGHFDAEPEAVRAIHRDTAGMLAAVFTQTPPLALGPAEVAAIRGPLTLARGGATRPCYRVVTDAAARLVPEAHHVVVPGAGHLLPEEHPEVFADRVRAHLGRALG